MLLWYMGIGMDAELRMKISCLVVFGVLALAGED